MSDKLWTSFPSDFIYLNRTIQLYIQTSKICCVSLHIHFYPEKNTDTEHKISFRSQILMRLRQKFMLETGKEQPQDKIGLCRCIIVYNPINHVAKKSIGTPVNNKYHKLQL